MFTHLNIKNFAIVKELDIDLNNGMTAITGETGAGKSIAIDALGLCLGDRADANSVRTGATKAEITAEFDLSDVVGVDTFLNDNGFENEEDSLIIRRVINSDGKSKAFINGSSATISQLKTLGEMLINIHGQSAHHQLFKESYQLNILDMYGDLSSHYEILKNYSSQIHKTIKSLKELEENKEKFEAKKNLLQFQLDELRKADPKEAEFEEIESEYNKLANIDDLMNSCQESLEIIRDNDNYSILSSLNDVIEKIQNISDIDKGFENILNMLHEAEISIEESYNEIHSYSDSIDADPQRLQFLEKRISEYEILAKKYHTKPENLFQTYQELLSEYQSMTNEANSEEELNNQLNEFSAEYTKAALRLSELRKANAQKLSEKITQHMHELAMPYGQFSIEVLFNKQASPCATGNDTVKFMTSVNPGQSLGPIGDVVSGGELARISLAIQEIYAEKVKTPSLIFDEVDTGISGQTANVVGKLLRNLGNSTQVICVTHLPQVAAAANHQYFVQKHVVDQTTETTMTELDRQGRICEIARLLSGDKVTSNSMASAEELLNQQ